MIPADKRAEYIAEIEEEVGKPWVKIVTDAEMDHFIIWAARCQTFFGKHALSDLGDAFRGFVRGCLFYVDAKARGIEE